MALVVENGTGLAAAESYASAAEYVAYRAARGDAEAEDADEEEVVEPALRRATAYIDGVYGDRWPGRRVKGRDQALDWPREYARDRGGYEIPKTQVPIEVKRATMEAAAREVATPNSLSADYTPAQRVTSETVGPISVTYADEQAGDVLPVVPVLDQILSKLLFTHSVTRFLERA